METGKHILFIFAVIFIRQIIIHTIIEAFILVVLKIIVNSHLFRFHWRTLSLTKSFIWILILKKRKVIYS